MNLNNTIPSAPVTDYVCPLCNGQLVSYTGSRGITVRCENPCDPDCHENPEGFGSTIKAAFEILKQKYKK